MQGDLLTIAEAAKRLVSVTEPTLRGMIQRRELEAVRVGRRVLIPEDELRRQFSVLYRPAGVAR
jgi:excisionase family DNA binding protein